MVRTDNYGGFTYNGIHCGKFGVWYVPDASHLGRRPGEFEVFSAQTPGRGGGYYYGSRYAPRVFELQCVAEEMTRGAWSRLLKWFDKDQFGELIFDDYPWMIWRARPTAMIEPETYVPADMPFSFETFANTRTFTVTLTAFTPFARAPGMALEDYHTILPSMRNLLLEETGFIASARMPVLNYAGFTSRADPILLYNPGDTRAPLKIKLAGNAGADGLYLFNRTTQQGCKFVHITQQETTAVDVYVEADAEYGTFMAVSPLGREPAYFYHDSGYIWLEGGFPIERGLSASYTNGSRQIVAAAGFNDGMIGKYVYLNNRWVRIEYLVSGTAAATNYTFPVTGMGTTDVVLMNEIIATSSSGTNLTMFEFSFSPAFS